METVKYQNIVSINYWRSLYQLCSPISRFYLLSVSGRSTYLSVCSQRESVSCCSHSSVEQSSIARHCCPLSLSIFCCRLKSHLFSLSYPTFWLFSHLYSARAV